MIIGVIGKYTSHFAPTASKISVVNTQKNPLQIIFFYVGRPNKADLLHTDKMKQVTHNQTK